MFDLAEVYCDKLILFQLHYIFVYQKIVLLEIVYLFCRIQRKIVLFLIIKNLIQLAFKQILILNDFLTLIKIIDEVSIDF